MKILVIHGPNINMLGLRDPKQYGTKTMHEINRALQKIASSHAIDLVFFQSNHEGAIVDFLQKSTARNTDGILINPGALTHYGYSLRDALSDTGLPIVEVHLSNTSKRETFRRIDVLEGIVIKKIIGHKEKSYDIGLQHLISYIQNHE